MPQRLVRSLALHALALAPQTILFTSALMNPSTEYSSRLVRDAVPVGLVLTFIVVPSVR